MRKNDFDMISSFGNDVTVGMVDSQAIYIDVFKPIIINSAIGHLLADICNAFRDFGPKKMSKELM